MTEPSTIDFRALCAELLHPLAEYDGANPYHEHRALIARARAALAAELVGEGPSDAMQRLLAASMDARGYVDLLRPAAPPAPEAPAEALAARPLLEQVARLGDCIGANTVGQIRAISSRAADWLRDNPPGQPVVIEPRGCPTPGACSCVSPPAPEPVGEVQRDAVIAAVTEALGGAYDCLRVWDAWRVGTMGQDDFARVAEDSDRVAEIADAAIEAMRPAAPPAPEPGEPGEVGELVLSLRETAAKLDDDWYHASARIMRSAATLLQQLSAPAPVVVPVGEVENLQHLIRFMCETWVAIDEWASMFSEEMDTYPMIQGTRNQMNLREIAAQSYDKKRVALGVQLMLPAHAIPLPQAGEAQP